MAEPTEFVSTIGSGDPLEIVRQFMPFAVGQEYGLHLQHSLEASGDTVVNTGCPLVDLPFVLFGDINDPLRP
jgi:hypothetical protein